MKKFRRGIVNSLLEYLILTHLESTPLCGYDIISLVYDRFGVLLSPGQVYPTIDQLAQQGLIQKEQQRRRVLLRLSSLGESLLKTWEHEHNALHLLLKDIEARREILA